MSLPRMTPILLIPESKLLRDGRALVDHRADLVRPKDQFVFRQLVEQHLPVVGKSQRAASQAIMFVLFCA